MSTQRELPRYQCHKRVWALKISALEIHQDGSATIAPNDPGYAPFRTTTEWRKHFEGDEDDLGYWVKYEDGYQSWSPTKAFEEGYTRI